MAKKPLFSPEKVRAAQDAHAAFRERVASLGWQAAYRTPAYPEFMRRASEAWPEGFFNALEPPYGDRANLDLLLRFLEEDPFFFRTGYAKQRALRLLSRWRLTRSDRRRVAKIVLAAVDGDAREEFRRYCRATRHADPEILLSGLVKRLDGEGTTAWQAFCAANAALGGGFPSPEQRRADPLPQIEWMRARLRALPEAR